MKTLRSLFGMMAWAVLMTGWASPTIALDIVDNTLGQTASLSVPGSSSSLATANRGYAFTIGSTPLSLSTVTFGIYGNASGTGSVGVKLYQATGVSGSAIQDTGTSSLSINAIGTATYYNYNVNWTLAANTTYTIAAYYVSGGTVTPRLATTSQTMSLNPSVTGIGFYDGSTIATNTYAVRFQSTTVPEPSTYVLAAIAAASCVVTRKRMAKA